MSLCRNTMMYMVALCAVTPLAHGARSVPCGGCTFDISEGGLLTRGGSCASDCTSLHLSQQSIRNITEAVFDGLSNLESLFLSDNQITILPEGIFHGLFNLIHLSFDNNQLTSLPEAIFRQTDSWGWRHLVFLAII